MWETGGWAQQGAPTGGRPSPRGRPAGPTAGDGTWACCLPRLPLQVAQETMSSPGYGAQQLRGPTPPQLSPQEQNPLSPALWVVPARQLGVG